MFGIMRAVVKGMLKRRQTCDDLFALVKRSAMKPRPLAFLTDSADISWEMVTGGEAGSFIEHWRTERLAPLLQEIAEQPTHSAQGNQLRGILLDEAAKGKWTLTVSRLAKEDAAQVLKDYPDSLAGARPLEWKLNHVGLEFIFTTLNHAVLLELGRKGFEFNTAELEAWVDLYTEAYGQLIAQAALLGADCGVLSRARIPSRGHHDILDATISMVAAMREDIAIGRANVDQNAGRYQRMAEGTRSLLDTNGRTCD